jgi:hypothetical protein
MMRREFIGLVGGAVAWLPAKLAPPNINFGNDPSQC